MAIPHCAIAHRGSSFAISVNCFSASSYQKECINATARSNGFCTGGEQEIGK